jgi:hypothetical protein
MKKTSFYTSSEEITNVQEQVEKHTVSRTHENHRFVPVTKIKLRMSWVYDRNSEKIYIMCCGSKSEEHIQLRRENYTVHMTANGLEECWKTSKENGDFLN